MLITRVLIVDDEAGSRQGLSELVRGWGYETDTASDGVEGLARAESFRPQVVIADLVMPRMDGLGLLSGLVSELDRLAVVMLTAKGSIGTAVEAMKIDTQQLRQVLERAVERNAACEEVERYKRNLETSGRCHQGQHGGTLGPRSRR